MQYDNYEQKIQKIARFLKPIFKHFIKITVSLAVLVAATVTLLAMRGNITVSATESFNTELIYGEELQYSASAFLSNVEYEYRAEGSEEWTKDFP